MALPRDLEEYLGLEHGSYLALALALYLP